MKTEKDKLIDTVIDHLKDDFAVGNFTVLEEILQHVPDEILEGSLSEVKV
jgi:hypothetical protein